MTKIHQLDATQASALSCHEEVTTLSRLTKLIIQWSTAFQTGTYSVLSMLGFLQQVWVLQFKMRHSWRLSLSLVWVKTKYFYTKIFQTMIRVEKLNIIYAKKGVVKTFKLIWNLEKIAIRVISKAFVLI